MYAEETPNGLIFPAGADVYLTDTAYDDQEAHLWPSDGLAIDVYSEVVPTVTAEGYTEYRVQLTDEIIEGANLPLPRTVFFTLMPRPGEMLPAVPAKQPCGCGKGANTTSMNSQRANIIVYMFIGLLAIGILLGVVALSKAMK